MKLYVNKISATIDKSSYNTFVVPKKISARMIESPKKFSPNIFKPRNHSLKSVERYNFTAEIIETLIVDSGGIDVDNSLSFQFNANSLVNGKFKIFHGWNTKNIDVTVIDALGREIDLPSQVTITHAEVDANRVTFNNNENWTLMIER